MHGAIIQRHCAVFLMSSPGPRLQVCPEPSRSWLNLCEPNSVAALGPRSSAFATARSNCGCIKAPIRTGLVCEDL
jgi:hypothetical protein